MPQLAPGGRTPERRRRAVMVLVETLGIASLSNSQVSEMAKGLDELVDDFRNRRTLGQGLALGESVCGDLGRIARVIFRFSDLWWAAW